MQLIPNQIKQLFLLALEEGLLEEHFLIGKYNKDEEEVIVKTLDGKYSWLVNGLGRICYDFPEIPNHTISKEERAKIAIKYLRHYANLNPNQLNFENEISQTDM